jgi:hypothetical protein
MAVVATVVALTAFGAPGVAQAAAPALKGTTVLRGTQSAAMRVRVTEPAVIDLTPVASKSGAVGPAALKTEGGKGYVGFLLTEPGSTDGLYILALRTPQALHDGSTTQWGVAQGQPAVEDRTALTGTGPGGADRCTQCRVPPGVYDLHLLTDGKPTKVTLTLKSGSSGQQTFKPSNETTAFGWTGGFKSEPGEDGEWVGGGMMMAMSWGYGRQNGIFLNTYELSSDASTLAAGTMQACRSLKNQETCDGERGFAGDRSSVAGAGTVTGWGVQSVMMSMDYEILGGSTYRLRGGVFWVSVSSGPARRPVADAPALVTLRHW